VRLTLKAAFRLVDAAAPTRQVVKITLGSRLAPPVAVPPAEA
jgi:hypothetical protein